jgi:hypothetical protein
MTTGGTAILQSYLLSHRAGLRPHGRQPQGRGDTTAVAMMELWWWSVMPCVRRWRRQIGVLVFRGLHEELHRSFRGGAETAPPPPHPWLVGGWRAESKGGDSKSDNTRTDDGEGHDLSRVGLLRPPPITFVVSGEFRLKRKCW